MDVSAEQKDALTELINIGVGHAASTLNCLIDHKIRLTVPEISFNHVQDLHGEIQMKENISYVSMGFRGDFDGNASLMFPVESARTLVAVLTGESTESTELEDLRAGALAEVGNILLNGVMGSVSNMLSATLDYSVPAYQESSLQEMLAVQKTEAVLIARANFYIDALRIEGHIMLFFEIASFQALLQCIDGEL